jgi:hypothetical protein
MKTKSLIFGLLFSAGLLFSLPVFAFSYTRTPPDYTISSAINFSGSVNPSSSGWLQYWKLAVQSPEPIYFGSCNASSTLTFNENIILPTGEYTLVFSKWFEEADCSGLSGETHWFEGNGESIIFEVVEVSTGGNIITLPEDFGTGFLAYAGTLFTDLLPFILIIIGLPLAFWIVNKVLSLTNRPAWSKREREIFGGKSKEEKFKKDDWL